MTWIPCLCHPQGLLRVQLQCLDPMAIGNISPGIFYADKPPDFVW